MSDLRLDLDTRELDQVARDLEQLDADLMRSAQLLAGQTHLHILQQTENRLHSRREMYVKALAKPTEISPGVWMITLKEEAVWIEEGMPPHSMVKDLLGDNPKTAADGSRYRVIPFEHAAGKGAATSTPAEMELVNAIKGELKKMRISWGKIDRNPDGTAKAGVLHRVEFSGDKPIRPAGTAGTPNLTNDPNRPLNQHGYGHGPVGQVMQGPSGIPFLRGKAVVSQTPLFNEDGTPTLDRKGRQAVKRSVTLFRIVSSKHEGTKWQYPGIEGTKFLDEALQWAEKEWEQKMMPELFKKYGVE